MLGQGQGISCLDVFMHWVHGFAHMVLPTWLCPDDGTALWHMVQGLQHAVRCAVYVCGGICWQAGVGGVALSGGLECRFAAGPAGASLLEARCNVYFA